MLTEYVAGNGVAIAVAWGAHQEWKHRLGLTLARSSSLAFDTDVAMITLVVDMCVGAATERIDMDGEINCGRENLPARSNIDPATLA